MRIALDFALPWCSERHSTPTPRAVSAAKVAASDAAYLATRTGLQVHGAIGYTREFDLSIWITRVRALVGAWAHRPTTGRACSTTCSPLARAGASPDGVRLSSEQAELAATVRTLLERRSDPAAVRTASESEAGYDESLWRTLCDQVGVAALAVPEEHDGIGAGFFETAVVLEELGRALTPAPLLPRPARSRPCSPVRMTRRARGCCRVSRPGSGHGRRGGRARRDAGDLALDADRASIVLAVRGGELVELHDPHVDVVATMDQTLRIGRVEARSASGRRRRRRRRSPPRPRHIGRGGGPGCGLCERGLRMSVEHTSNRVQFGRPIGSFQALKHRMADMLARTEMAARPAGPPPTRSATRQPCPTATPPSSPCGPRPPTRSRPPSTSPAETVQLHGGIAITWEHDAHRLFKRAHALGHLAGDARQQRAAVLS